MLSYRYDTGVELSWMNWRNQGVQKAQAHNFVIELSGL